MRQHDYQTVMLDVFVRRTPNQALYKKITWYAGLTNLQAWTLIEQIRALLLKLDPSGFYQHDVTTNEEIEH